MDVIQKRFPTLAVNIFNNLDGQSLVNFKDTNKENYEFMDQERFYWIRILKKYNDYFETSKESWKKSTSKIQARFVKKLAMATLNFFKTASIFMIDSFSPTINQLRSNSWRKYVWCTNTYVTVEWKQLWDSNFKYILVTSNFWPFYLLQWKSPLSLLSDFSS